MISLENGTISNQREGLKAGVYNLTITDGLGCSAENEVNLNAPKPLGFEIEIFDPSCYNENDGFILIDSTTGGVAPYLFSMDGNNFLSSNQFTSLTAGGYKTIMQDANGCETEQFLELIEPEQMIVDLGEEIILQLGDSIQLKPLINFPINSVDTFFWRTAGFSDFYPWITPTSSAEYSIVVINHNNCIAEDQVSIKVKKDRQVFVPNIFTPNDDGLNDRFYPECGKGVKKINTCQIFNRWGAKVYESNGMLPGENNKGWDGRFKEEEAATGVYLYFMKVEFMDGRVEVYSGDLSLLR